METLILRRALARTAILFACTLPAACTLGPDWKAPKLWAPSHWDNPAIGAATAQVGKQLPSQVVQQDFDPAWWNTLHDPELTALEQRVAASNLNVRIAGIRLAESRLQRRITSADELPTAQVDGSYTREKLSSEGVLGLFGGAPSSAGSFASGGSSANGLGGRSGAIPSTATGGKSIPAFNLWQYGFDASWELDLWGRVRRGVESADASVQASADARRSGLLSVVAEVARDFMQLRGIQDQLRITRENIETDRQSLALTQDRFRGGLTTELDVANAAAQLASVQAEIPQLEQQQNEQINALSFLLGEAPQALRAELITPNAVPPVPPSVPVGLPSELARRRPDIRQAEDQLHAATADIGVAVADFYPKFTFDGSVGIQALAFSNLGNAAAGQYGFGPTINIPIFQGGKLRATLELRKVQQQEAALNYQQTVLQAWHDVDNAFTGYAAEQHRREALGISLAQNRKALDIARQRYTQGVADFLNVLDAERGVLTAQLQMSQSNTTVSQNFVQLYKALGGGWETEFPVAGK